MLPEMSGALKALTMLRNVPLYHLPSYQIHGSWKSNRPPFSVCPRVSLQHILPKTVKPEIHKKSGLPLDKPDGFGYNKDKESVPKTVCSHMRIWKQPSQFGRSRRLFPFIEAQIRKICSEHFTNNVNALDKNVQIHSHSLPSGSWIDRRRPFGTLMLLIIAKPDRFVKISTEQIIRSAP